MRNITEYHLSQRQYNDPDGYLFSDRKEEWRDEKLLPEFMGFFSLPLCYLFVRIFSLITEKFFFLGIGCINGMFLLISKSSSLFFQLHEMQFERSAHYYFILYDQQDKNRMKRILTAW